MATNTSGHDVYTADDEGNPVVVPAGADVPEGVTLDDEFTAEETVEYTEQVRDELLKTARSNLLPVQESWTTDQLAQAVRLHEHAVATGGSVDWDSFPESSDVEPASGSGDDDSSHDVAALAAEYESLTGNKPRSNWRPATLAAKVEEARAAQS